MENFFETTFTGFMAVLGMFGILAVLVLTGLVGTELFQKLFRVKLPYQWQVFVIGIPFGLICLGILLWFLYIVGLLIS